MKNIFLATLLGVIGCDSNGDSEGNGEPSGDDEPSTSSRSNCPKEAIEHTTSSGITVCCDADEAVFCDESDSGYPGGCWPAGTDCATITMCGDRWAACPEGAAPFCDESGTLVCEPCPTGSVLHETRSGRPYCCDDDFPLFCDENDAGYPGGCWPSEVDCATITYCGDHFGACPAGQRATCTDNDLICQ